MAGVMAAVMGAATAGAAVIDICMHNCLAMRLQCFLLVQSCTLCARTPLAGAAAKLSTQCIQNDHIHDMQPSRRPSVTVVRL